MSEPSHGKTPNSDCTPEETPNLPPLPRGTELVLLALVSALAVLIATAGGWSGPALILFAGVFGAVLLVRSHAVYRWTIAGVLRTIFWSATTIAVINSLGHTFSWTSLQVEMLRGLRTFGGHLTSVQPYERRTVFPWYDRHEAVLGR